MAESAVSTPPVPKPRTGRPTPTPPTPTLSPPAPTPSPPAPAENTDRVGDIVRDSSPDPPPYSSLLSPSPTLHTHSDSDSEASVSDVQLVVRRKRTTPTQLDEEDDDYENIDAILDDETRENVRRSNYINWVYQDSDGEEGQSSRGADKLGHDRYAPSIKLDRHPALKKSQSNSEIDSDAATAAAQFIDALRKRPRNKAPPPPPGRRGSKDKGQSLAAPSSGHKRSQSDLHLSGYSQEPSRLTRPNPPTGGQKLPGHQSPGQKRGVAKLPPVLSNQRTPEIMRHGRNSPLLGVKGGSKEATNVKPKRHAPPPPMARRGGTPEYAVVNKHRTRTGDQSDPTPRRWSKTSSNESTGPPKPLRAHRAQSIEDLSQTASPVQDRSVGVANRSSLLDNMDVFTLELRKEPQVSFGLVIVSGKVRRSTGESTLEGVFIQRVIPDSPADNDGRIQPGDMLLEVGGRGTMGGVLSETIDLLKEASESIRLKIARPDMLSSVFAVEGGDEQPIYENKILPPAEMLLKLHQTEGRVIELETDKERAMSELVALREETDREKAELNNQLEEMRREFEDTKRESDVRSGELTQALASVTVGKTKTESEVERLRSEISTLRDKLNEASETERELHALKDNNSSLVSELARERQLSTQLQERLDIAESARDSDTEEIAKLCKTLETQEKQISSLTSELEQLRNTRVTPVRAAHAAHVTSDPDPAPLDQTFVKEVANGNDSHNEDELCDSDDAFDDEVPSPVIPSPYLDFVPLEEKGRKERKKDPGSKSAKKPDECNLSPTEGGGGVANNDDLLDPTAATIAEFDAMTINMTPLNSSAAIHKSQVSRKLLRKRPSKQHLKKMGSSSDLLEGLPEIETSPTTEINEQGTPNFDNNYSTAVQPPGNAEEDSTNPGEKEGKMIIRDELSTTTDVNKVESVVIIPEVHHETPPPQPKPRPRARVRHMPSLEENKPPPQAAPRHREPTPIEGGGPHSREGSPLPAHKPPPAAHKPSESANSPLLKKKEPILPSSKPSPKQLPKFPKIPPISPNVELKLTEDSTSGDIIHPTPHPRHVIEQPPQEIEEESISVKAGGSDLSPVVIRAVSAPGSPAKSRLPPPVARKPKLGEHDDGQLSPKRSMSFDDELEASPRHRKKMPAGAVNIMGFLPMTTKLKHLEIGGGGRERSCTVSTTEPGARERDTLKRQIEKHEASPIQIKPPEEETTPPVQDEDQVVMETKKLPPKRPPLPTAKKPENNGEQVDGLSSDDWDSDASPMLATKMEHKNEAGLDCSSVLSWSPEVVGLWVDKIGLGRYQSVFVERGVVGGSLFDMDGHTLKGMGIESHDDRSVFKRELKNLKPFADKQRKAMEKLKREEKKIAKKLKKK